MVLGEEEKASFEFFAKRRKVEVKSAAVEAPCLACTREMVQLDNFAKCRCSFAPQRHKMLVYADKFGQIKRSFLFWLMPAFAGAKKETKTVLAGMACQ